MSWFAVAIIQEFHLPRLCVTGFPEVHPSVIMPIHCTHASHSLVPFQTHATDDVKGCLAELPCHSGELLDGVSGHLTLRVLVDYSAALRLKRHSYIKTQHQIRAIPKTLTLHMSVLIISDYLPTATSDLVASEEKLPHTRRC